MATISLASSHKIIDHFNDNILPNVVKKRVQKITPRSKIVKEYIKALSKRTFMVAVAKPKTIFEEMKALLKITEAIYYDAESETLTMMTEEVISTRSYTRGKSYGNFFIIIPLTKAINSLPVFYDYMYGIRIYAPYRQSVSDGLICVAHVNLQLGSVCLGDGNIAITRLKQGYISEFFEIVQQFLKYNG